MGIICRGRDGPSNNIGAGPDFACTDGLEFVVDTCRGGSPLRVGAAGESDTSKGLDGPLKK